MITEVPGVLVGHHTDEAGRTGCTVVLFPEGSVASGEVRGGAPATREFALLAPGCAMTRIDAVLLTGGSAFGLAAADGVMSWCEQHGRGFTTKAGPVPIVVAMALFDLAEGDPSARPRAEHGFAACEVASAGPFPTGRVGAGTGATVDKWRGVAHRRPGGLGTATRRDGDLVVSALVAVNAFGAIDDGADHPWPAPDAGAGAGSATAFEHTTIGVIATNAALDKVGCSLVAQSGHDGLARALLPVHTQADGDALVAVATGPVEADVDHVRLLAVRCVEAAVRSVHP